MGRSQQTFNKLEKEKKRQKKKQEKLAKKEEQKKNKGKGDLESMMAYVDEFGNIVDTPPDPSEKKEEIKLEDIQISTARDDEQPAKKQGRVDFYDPEKKFGFITEKGRKGRYFFHISEVDPSFDIKDNDFVEFDFADTPKGRNCVNITESIKK